MKEHFYKTTIKWSGNLGNGTSAYNAYNRNHVIMKENGSIISGSSDPEFRGDDTRFNPEELLVSSLSSCHMLWYLHLCASSGIIVIRYEDHAEGIMQENKDGGGQFTSVTLRPKIQVKSQEMVKSAESLHARASEKCFIANSVNFPVKHISEIYV